jgi:drug/metabolite transporter (DMT)-like permease
VYFALIVASLLWASLYTAAKPAVAATGPFQVALCRVALACLCLGALVLARGGTRALARTWQAHWRGILLLGLLNFVLSQLLTLNATNYLPASVNGVLNNTHPLWVAIGTTLLFTPQRPWLLVGGSVIALLGVTLVFLPGLDQSASGVTPLGVLLSLAGSAVIATCTVIGRRIMPGSDPLAVSALASGTAVVPMALLSLTSGGISPILTAPLDIKLLLAYLGVGCTAINFALWYYGLKHMAAAPASAFQYLIPPMSVVLATVFLGEPITAFLLIGTLCILVGLAATQVATTTVRKRVLEQRSA